MKRALISDIHSNLEALIAVLGDIDKQGVDEVYCLGDIVGYGPDPRACLERVMKMQCCILGNHDAALLTDPDDMSPDAFRAICWTREQLTKGDTAFTFDFIGGLPRIRREGRLMFVHGSPCEPTHEYVFRMDVHNQQKMDALFSRIEHYCFQGHTHVPGVFTRERFIGVEACDYRYPLGEEKLMINVGSVGQPRDGDARACYVILKENEIVFRRVDYPVTTTVEKILAIPELDRSFADRLLMGQ